MPRPAPKKVATVQAQKVLRVAAGNVAGPDELLIVGAFVAAATESAEVLEYLRVEYR